MTPLAVASCGVTEKATPVDAGTHALPIVRTLAFGRSGRAVYLAGDAEPRAAT